VAAPERKDKPILQTGIAPPVLTAPAGPGALGRLLSSKWTWIAALVLIAAGGAWFLFQPSQVAQEAPLEDNTLALRVERNAGQLLLSWNRGAPLIQTAQRATLTISDGDHKEDVDLDLGQLRSGSVVYSPMTNDVSFRLEVTDLKRGKSASESVRVLAGRPSPMQQQPLAIPPAAGEAVPEQLEDGGLAAVGDETAEAAQPEAGAPGQPTRTFVAPQVTAAAPRADSLAARLAAPDPSLVASGGVATAPLGLQTQRTLAPPPPAAKPAAQPAVGGRVQEATLLRSVTPLYPPLARQARVSGTVRVEASIGVDGKVKSAKAVSGPPLLRQAAVDAVLRWTYAPATLNGQPVDSNTQVDVGFTLGR
jgi:TonB family protein